MGAFSKQGASDKEIVKSSPAFWERAPPLGFTYLRA